MLPAISTRALSQYVVQTTCYNALRILISHLQTAHLYIPYIGAADTKSAVPDSCIDGSSFIKSFTQEFLTALCQKISAIVLTVASCLVASVCGCPRS